MGLGFTYALTLLGFIRELFGNLSVFGLKITDADGMLIFILAPGAFITLGFIIAFNKWLSLRKRKPVKPTVPDTKEVPLHA